MLRPRPGLPVNLGSSGKYYITTGPQVSTPVYSSTKRKMLRPRPGLPVNLGSSGEYYNYGTTGVDACLLINEEEKGKKWRRKRFWVHNIHNKRNAHGEFHTLFPDLMEDDVKFFQYFIHCAYVFYFVRFSRDENADARFMWYRSLAGIFLWHHQQEPHATKKLLSREFESHFPVVDSCDAGLWMQTY